MKRQIAWVMALLIAGAGALAACGDSTAAPTDTDTAAVSESAVDSSTAVTEVLKKDNLPDNLDFGGEKITIHIRNGDNGNPEGNCVMEMTVEGLNGELLNDAIYNRNLAVSERLNVEIDPYVSYDWTQYGQALKEIRESISAGDDMFDIIAGWCNGDVTNLALEGCFLELDGVNYLDTKQPWWNQGLANATPMGGKTFFVTGESNILTSLGSAFSVFVNENIQNAFDLGSLADYVIDGTWTIDKMSEIAKTVQNDLNGDGAIDADNDRVGLVLLNYISADAFYTSLDCHQIESDNDGNLSYVPDIERIHTALTKVVDLHYNNPGVLGWLPDITRDIFVEGRALMTLEYMEAAREQLRGMEDSYYIIPMPKLDENQDQYYSYIFNNLTVQSVPVTNGNPDATFATMEALASESYYNVTPVFFEDCMQNKYARSETTVQMLEIIRDSCYVDYEYIYGDLFRTPAFIFRDQVSRKKSDAASYIEKNSSKIESAIEKAMEQLGQ